MKKRILSLLLLLAMLVTMIPVATVAAEEKAQTQENGATGTDHDYHDLYITNGLVGLFTAMDKDDDTVKPTNDGNGTWLNRVSGKANAALGGLFWRRTENGGIGYDLYRGAADDANGTNYVDAPVVNGAATNTYDRTSFLLFGLSLLPNEDFTVEYVAEYLPIYTRLTGEDAVIGSKVVGDAYTFNAPGMTTTAGIYGTGTDYFGYLAGFTGARDGRTESAEVRGVVRWLAASYQSWNNCRPTDPDGVHHYNTTLAWAKDTEIFHKRGGIYTFAVMADENTADGKNEATYTMFHDRAVLRTSTVASYSFVKADGSVYQNLDYTVDSANDFRLSHNLPTDFYVVRIYERTLNTAEQAQNHAIDVLEYYNLAIDKAVVTANIDALSLMFAGVGFEKDAIAKSAIAKDLQEKLNLKGYQGYNNVTDGLVAFFSAQGDNADTVDLTAGTWTDFFGGNVASLKGKTWKYDSNNGFLGFNIYRGQADADGSNYVDQVSTNNYWNGPERLELGIALLPEGDYTVDYMAEYKPIYTLLTGTTDEIVGEAFDFNNANWEQQYYNRLGAVEALGYLTGWTTVRDGVQAGAARGGVRWVIGGGALANSNSTAIGLSHGMDLLSSATYRSRGKAHTEAITRSGSVYQIIEDAVVLKTSTGFSAGIDFSVKDDGQFYLSDRLPTDFFSLRIYDRALSEGELLQNTVADKLLFYGITLPEKFADPTQLAIVNSLLPDPSSSMDAVEIAAKRLSVNKFFGSLASYVTDGLVSFFSAQGGNANSVDLAAGKWTDFYGNNVASLQGSTWSLNANGFLGFNIYRGQANADGTNYVDSVSTNNYNVKGANGSRLNLGIALLPQGDYTIDYMAEYKPIYTLKTGTTDVIVGEAYDFQTAEFQWTEQYWNKMPAVDYIGYMQGWTTCRDDDQGFTRGGVRFAIDKGIGGTTVMGVKHIDLASSTTFRARGAAHAFAIVRDADIEGGSNEATYAVWQDAAVLGSYTQKDIAKADFTVADTGEFYLSDCLPTDFFALRIYDRALTEAELFRNMVADKVAFYGLDVSVETFDDPAKLADLNSKIPAPSSDMSAQEVAATRLKIEKLFAVMDMYVTDGLTAFFAANSVFADTVDLAAGTWTDVFTGLSIALNGDAWHRKANGFVGFDLYRGVAMADGTGYEDVAASNNYAATNCLNLGISLLPADDYTVDYTAQLNPIYTLNKDGSGEIVGEAYTYYENGTVEWPNEMWTGSVRDAVNCIGYLTVWTEHRDGPMSNGWRRGSHRFAIASGTNYSTAAAHRILAWESSEYDIFYTRNVGTSFSIVRDEFTDTDDAYKAEYTMYRGGTQWSEAAVIDSSKADFTGADTGSFILANRLPTDFFSVRIYNRALTKDELVRNAVADKVTFYGIELPKETFLDAEKLAEINGRIPAIDSSMDAAEIAAVRAKVEELLDPKMLDLYVTDGLTAFFSAQGVFADSANLDAGTWTDLYAGNVATLTGSTWTKTANGLLGFNIYRGQADADGTNYVDSVATNNYYSVISRLDFGLGLLPKGDFTIDYAAEYKPIYTLLTGTTDEIVCEAYTYHANGTVKWTEQYWNKLPAVDHIGYLQGWTTLRDGTEGFLRNGVRWAVDQNAKGTNVMTNSYLDFAGDAAFRPRGAAYTYSIVRDENIADGANEATYSIVQNAAALKSYTQTDITKADFTVDDTGSFYLSDRLPTDFYAVRIYDRALNEAELRQNAVADRLTYYGIELSETTLNGGDEVMEAVYGAILGFGLETDATEKEATKLLLKAAIADAEYALTIEDLDDTLYVQDGLTAIFTAFRGQGKFIVGDKWTDRLSGKGLATLAGSTWSYSTKSGGIGFNIYRGQADDAAGTNYVDSVGTNNYYVKGENAPRLQLGLDLLPKGDFTVDYTAEYKPIYTLKTGSTSEIVGEAYDYQRPNDEENKFVWGEQYWNKLPAVEAYGYLTGWTTLRDGVNGGSVRGGVRWVIAGGDVSGTVVMGKNHGIDFLSDASYRPRGAAHSYAVTRDETDATAVYQIIQDAAVLKTSTGFEDGIDFTVDDNGDFYLSHCLPTTFYALRIYDRALTERELQMNRLGDLISFYRITLADDILEDSAKLTALAAASSVISMSTDAVEAAGAVLTFNEIIAKINVDTRMYDLYVQDGLKANYTALSNTDTSVVLESGLWTNRVEGAPSATLARADAWKKNANGSVGFTLYRGMIDAEGNYTDESQYNTFQSVGAQLTLDPSLIPAGDFTVEYVAEYKHLYAVDVDGNPVRETFENGNNGVADATQVYYWGPVTRIGYLNAFTGLRDGYFQTETLRGNVWWVIHNSGSFEDNSPTDDNKVRHYFTYMKPVEGDTVFHKQGGVFTFAITRDVTLDETHNMATYSLLHDNALLKSATVEKVEYVHGGVNKYNVDFYEEEKQSFFLSNRLPTDFYALRVYDRTLTYEEHLQNHFADIAIYYELALDDAIYTDVTMLNRCIHAFANAQIATDGVQKAANKKAYQELLNSITEGTAGVAYNYDELFVKDGLVALYSAFEGDTSISTFNGTWANKVEGSAYGAAIIRNPAAWERKTVGYGYSMTYDRWEATAMNTGISLPTALENLDDFTVEAFATVEGITNEDGSRFVNTFAKDENGNSYKDENGNWVYTGKPGGDHIADTANFRFGLLTNLFFPSLYPTGGGGSSISGRWYLYNKGYPKGSVPAAAESVVLEKIAVADDPATEDVDETTYTNVDAGWRLMGPEAIPTAGVMHVVKETGTSTVSYAISYNCSKDPMQSATVSIGKYEDLLMVQENEKYGAGRFSLFNAIPTTVYAIRVYNRVLTEAEKLQNNFIDKAGFYGLNLDGYKALSAEEQAKVHLGFANVGTNLTREEVDSILNFYVSNNADSVNEMVNALVTFSEYLPITAGAYGYRALFTPSFDVQALFEANGYKVFYGALVAPGGKYNAVEDLTVSYADGKLTANNGVLVEVEGEGLTPTFYNYVGSGDAAHRYSAAVTASDAKYFGVDMLVRGYAVVVAPDGTVTAAYDINEATNGSLSILEAADYFVNAYNGPVDTMYKYMNSAALRYILSASGVAARVDLTADLVLYVDAANGSDANSGLLKSEAYATITKAFEAAKAHLAKTGRKGVTIQLADGTYHIDQALAFSAEEIKADSYYLNVVGNGEGTVLTSVVEINRDDVQYDGDVAIVQLPGVTVAGKTVYPEFRALYGDGELLDIAHFGGDEETYNVLGAYVIDAQGNVLPKDPAKTEDWQLTAEDAEKASQIVFKLPYEMFEYGSASDYVGTELHWMSTMRFIIMPIDHIAYQDEYVEAFVDTTYFLDVSSFDYHITGSDCFIENSKGTLLATPDTYYYDETTGLLYFNQADKWVEDFESFGYAAAENAFIFDGLKNVTVSNMTITGLDSKYLKDGVGMYLGQSAMAKLTEADGTVTEGSGDGFAMTPAGILGQGMTDLVVNNVVFRDTLGAGIVLKGVSKNIYIDSNVFTNLGDTAIRVGYGYIYQGSYIIGGEITNNLITDIGNLYNTASGITIFTAADLLVAGNTIAQVPYTGVTLGWAWSPQQMSADTVKKSGGSFNLYNVEFAYNYITDYLMSQRDGGAVYTLGGYNLSMMGTEPVNFMHHNYVNLSYETGLLDDDRWSIMGYYHDFGVTNWSNYENVLVNTMGAKGSGIYPVHLQNWVAEDGLHTVDSAHTFVDNYFIGYDTPEEVYGAKAAETFSEKYFNTANDYIFASVDDLANNTSIGAVAYGETCLTKESSATAANDVAAIFAAAGSTLGTEYKDSALDWTADAAAKVLVLDDTRKISGNLPVYKITFTDGEVTTHTFALEGATLTVPTLFVNDYAEITYAVDGVAIDPDEYNVPAKDITVNVTMTVPTHNVTFTDGIDTETVSVAEGSKLEVPAIFRKEGYKLTFTMEGAPFELDEFVMGENDVNISIRYEKMSFRVTFVNALGESSYVVAEYGAKVYAPAALNKTGYTNKYSVNGTPIDLAIFTVPANNVTVDVTYNPIPYRVTFILPDNETVFATTMTPFGTEIVLPNIAVGDYVDVLESEDYRYKFVGWEGYTEGDTLEAANHNLSFVMLVEAEAKAPQYMLGDIDGNGVVEGIDITLVTQIASGILDISSVVGDPDLDGNGVVEGIDITLVTQIASGILS